ncbi:MAG: 16S rRNA (cytosine(1407)-C(5))-methyltransferase RsmF [Anaerolineales bacterium]
MQKFLGAEFPAFAESLDSQPRSGLRVNTLKLTPQRFQQITPLTLGERVPWCDSAFELIPGAISPGLHPHHLAGLYYLQDPSAMSPAELLAPQPGERVLDLSAAPGGKTTQMAALMQGRGLLVANDIKDKRVGHLIQNADRWGAQNIAVTNETPERLADHFGAYFDRVLVDAPCSGEGMFRKDMGARADWSPEMVAGCAARQGSILRVAAKLVRPGGFLLYSTCTFAPEEDEGAVSGLLGQFSVVELPLFPGFMRGQPGWLGVNAAESLRGAVRLFPHRLNGDGHFVCLLQKTGGAMENRLEKRTENQMATLARAQLALWREFAEETLNAPLPEERLRLGGERLYLLPEESPDFGRLRLPRPGVWLGTFKKGRFEPAHPLALTAAPRKTQPLAAQSPELAAYLRGETLPSSADGWTVVTVDGFGLGWGKAVQGILKNHYPKGWLQN